METTKLPVPYLLSISCLNNDDTTIAMRHACERTWSIYCYGAEICPDERLVRIGNFRTNIFEYEFTDIFPVGYDIPARHEIKYENAQI